jgi:hypothetical protein
MQNQIALYLIFATGILLVLSAVLNWDLLFGAKNKEANNPAGFLTQSTEGIMNWFTKPFILLFGGAEDPKRAGKRSFYAFLGIIIIILGIIALNSGKFS